MCSTAGIPLRLLLPWELPVLMTVLLQEFRSLIPFSESAVSSQPTPNQTET